MLPCVSSSHLMSFILSMMVVLIVSFFIRPILGVSNLPDFRVEMRESYRQSDILFSAHSVPISLTQPASTFIKWLKWQVFRERLSCQLFTIPHICTRFSAFLSCVEDLRISATQALSPSGKSVITDRFFSFFFVSVRD